MKLIHRHLADWSVRRAKRTWVVAFTRSLATMLLVCGGWCGSATANQLDSWTDLRGTSTINAEFLGQWNQRVYLRLENGRRISVRKEDLDADSRLLADRRTREFQQQKQQLRDQLRTAAAEAAAPAPAGALNPPAQPTAPLPAYQPPANGADLKTTLENIRDQVIAGHPRVLYDSLPPSHQQAISEAFTSGIAKLEPTSWDQARLTLANLSRQVISKQNWLFSHPKMKLLSETQRQQLLANAAILQQLLGGDLLSVAALQTRSWDESLNQLDQTVGRYLHEILGPQAAMLTAVSFEVNEASNGRHTVKINLPVVGPVASADFVAHEERWVWGTNATAWPESLKQLVAKWEAVEDGSVAIPSDIAAEFQQLQQAAANLAQANSEAAFHDQLDEVLPIVGQLLGRIDLNSLQRALPSSGGYGSSNYGSGSPGSEEARYGTQGIDYGDSPP